MGRSLLAASLRSRLLFSSSSSAPPPPLLRRSPFYPLLGDSRSIETLAYEEIRTSEKPFNATAFVIHGLLGSGRNWRTFSRKLASEIHQRNPSQEWRMVLVDLRNHGRSTGLKGLDPPHDMANAARDLASLVKAQGWSWPDAIIAHSMGGKVALDYVQSCACGNYGESAVLPKQLWMLDSVPGELNSDYTGDDVEKVLQTLSSLPSPLPSRQWVVNHMLSLGFSKSMAEWMGSNVKKEGEIFTWAFDLQGANEMFKSLSETSYWSLVEHPPKGVEIAFVVAENSPRWTPAVLQRLESLSKKGESSEEGKISVHVLPKSGHWVHVDNPQGLLEIMVPRFISKI